MQKTDFISQQLIDFMEIIHDLTYEKDLDYFGRGILNGINNFVPSDRSIIVLRNDSAASLDFFRRNIHEKKDLEYRDYYYLLDPFSNVKSSSSGLQLVSCLPQGRTVVALEDIVEYSDFVSGEYYTDFLQTLDIHYELEIYLKYRNRVIGFIALLRSRNFRSFSDMEICFARASSPILSLALDNFMLHKKNSPNVSAMDFLKKHQELEIAGTTFNLSKRELDVVRYMCEGLKNSEIADRLCISRLTVKTHIQNIYEKNGINSRSALVCKIMSGSIPGNLESYN